MDMCMVVVGVGIVVDGDLSVVVNFDYEQVGELKIGQVGIVNLCICIFDVECFVQEMCECVICVLKLFGCVVVIFDFGGLSQVLDVVIVQVLVDGLCSVGVLLVVLVYGISVIDLFLQQFGLLLLVKFCVQYECVEVELVLLLFVLELCCVVCVELKLVLVMLVVKVVDVVVLKLGCMQLGNVCLGQQLYVENCDLIVMVIVGVGVEVIVDGSIYIYGILCGCVLVGVQGNIVVCIFCCDFYVELVVIVGYYKVLDDVLDNLCGKVVQVWLEQDQIKIVVLD